MVYELREVRKYLPIGVLNKQVALYKKTVQIECLTETVLIAGATVTECHFNLRGL